MKNSVAMWALFLLRWSHFKQRFVEKVGLVLLIAMIIVVLPFAAIIVLFSKKPDPDDPSDRLGSW